MPAYEINALVHLNVDRVIVAETEAAAIKRIEALSASAYGLDLALVDVQMIDEAPPLDGEEPDALAIPLDMATIIDLSGEHHVDYTEGATIADVVSGGLEGSLSAQLDEMSDDHAAQVAMVAEAMGVDYDDLSAAFDTLSERVRRVVNAEIATWRAEHAPLLPAE